MPSSPDEPAVARGAGFFGFSERFNRYYTDPDYKPQHVLYVSPAGSGDGSSADAPSNPREILSDIAPGTTVHFLRGDYVGCYELGREQSGTYNDPVVLVGERNEDGTLGVKIDCCTEYRATCFNIEAANYVAIDGFELVGGSYGVRTVSSSYAAKDHQVGGAVLHSEAHGQSRDPFFTGGADWFVIEGSLGYDVGTDDGHGIYLSNGSDFNIVRYNETIETSSSDFQINADPLSTCIDEGVDVFDDRCAGKAGTSPDAGAGASDYFLVEGNFFRGSRAQGPNFTSVRYSRIVNNIFSLAQKHGTSFWQETENPDLGSHDNYIAHNFFITNSGQHAVQFVNESTNNQFLNNIVMALDGQLVDNPNGLLLETDASTRNSTTLAGNFWISGRFGAGDGSLSPEPGPTDHRFETFQGAWLSGLRELFYVADTYAGTAEAPWHKAVPALSEVLTDRIGQPRTDPTDAGPFEKVSEPE